MNTCLELFLNHSMMNDSKRYGFIARTDENNRFTRESYPLDDIGKAQLLLEESIHQRFNTYYNIGIFKSSKEACMDNLEQVTELYCDIDNHLGGGFDLRDAQSCIDQMNKYFDVDIPKPSRIEYTGRGLQLHWYLKECRDLTKWRLVEKGIQTLIDGIFEKEAQLFSAHSLEIDRGASNQNRYLRAPGSFNTKSQTTATTIYKERVAYDLNEIIRKYEIPVPKDAKRRGIKSLRTLADINPEQILSASELEQTRWSKEETWYKFKLTNEKRLNDLYKVQQLRNARGYTEGYRSNIIREYCNICKALYPGDTKAQATRVHEFNTGFIKPLPESQVNAWIRATWRSKGNIQHKNEYIIEFLQISASELENLETIHFTIPKEIRNAQYYQENKATLQKKRNKRYSAEKKANQKTKSQRIKQAKQLYAKGKTTREIAIEIGVSATTVSRYLKK